MYEYHYICGGCGKREVSQVQRVTTPIFKSMDVFLREGGLCKHSYPTIEDKLPESWGICVLGICYCKECFSEIYPDEES